MRRTYPTRCFRCNAPVFYHTNGYGDHVLFDALTGAPWPVHDCWVQHAHAKNGARDEREARVRDLTVAKEIAAGSRPVEVRPVAGESTVERIVRENQARQKALRDYRDLDSTLRARRWEQSGRQGQHR